MSTYRITCIQKTNRVNPHERILNVGLEGSTKRYPQQQIVQWIDSGLYKFYVLQGGRKVDVITARSLYGHRYIKTRNDGMQPNNLLALPECVR